jgi:hypothetical protein
MYLKKILGIAITRKGGVELIAADEQASKVLPKLEKLDPAKYEVAGLVLFAPLTNKVRFEIPAK